jgi:hypoxanthine-DNA glycosylase
MKCQIDQNTNRFWHLLGDVIGEPLPGMGYAARLQALLDHRVGLWDVIAKARREGSLDSRIRDHSINGLAALVAGLPNLAAVAFNGGTAAKIGTQALAESGLSLDLVRLPSSSPAYAAVPYAEKLRAWEALRKWLAA